MLCRRKQNNKQPHRKEIKNDKGKGEGGYGSLRRAILLEARGTHIREQ
jgi:hypothetical protein